jgi:hypothetical protein
MWMCTVSSIISVGLSYGLTLLLIGDLMTSLLDRIRGGLRDEEAVDVEDVESVEPNPFEEYVVSASGLSVDELERKIVADRGVDLVVASKGIYRAVEEGKIQLVDLNPPRRFFEFFRFEYSAWFWFTLGFVGLLFYAIYLMPQIYPFTYFRYAVGAIYVLYVPGFTLIEALYPKKTELERLERFALSIGLSLALVPLVGLVLNYTPWGIRLDPIFAALGILTVALGLAGVYRKYSYWRLMKRIS